MSSVCSQPKRKAPTHLETEKNNIAASSTYNIQGRTFIVEPVFQEEGAETLASLLLNLLRAEAFA